MTTLQQPAPCRFVRGIGGIALRGMESLAAFLHLSLVSGPV